MGKATTSSHVVWCDGPKIAESLGIAESKAQSYLDARQSLFPRGPVLWKRRDGSQCRSKGGCCPRWCTRHLAPLLLSDDKWIAQKALRQASNARIQGGRWQSVRTVMAKIWASTLLDQYDFRFYWPVHDEIVVSVIARMPFQ